MKVEPDPTKPFLGVGWAFPPNVEADGSIAEAVYEEDVRQAIRIIIFTNRGERVMRPDFGAGLNEFIFESINTTTMALVETRVREALITWEPRIEVLDVTVTSDASERNKLLIDLNYKVRATNTLHNLVYPFYLEEGSPA
ncbi:MAG TPA: GPW/gp25 family protein [Pyrinomonadaceae bacterium]|nr:GPW/gp25 family protein [Pyrinomonadaceae bacterium]